MQQAGKQAGFVKRNLDDVQGAISPTLTQSNIMNQLNVLTDKAHVLANGNYAVKRALTSYEMDSDAQTKPIDEANTIENRLSDISSILDNAIASMRLSIDTLGIE
jgi:hypothetical protein